MEPQDRMLICRTCGKQFAFSEKEREFFNARNFAEPRHCYECRAERKKGKGNEDDASARPVTHFSPRSSNREWTQVECASCGKPASVPFKPVSGRPVYCRDCFAAQKTALNKGTPEDIKAPLPQQAQPQNLPTPKPAPTQVSKATTLTEPDWFEDPGPLPEIEPGPDEEGEITVAEFMPMGTSFGSTPEEVNPTFNDDEKEHPGANKNENKKP